MFETTSLKLSVTAIVIVLKQQISFCKDSWQKQAIGLTSTSKLILKFG